jgi:hypothetical protein
VCTEFVALRDAPHVTWCQAQTHLTATQACSSLTAERAAALPLARAAAQASLAVTLDPVDRALRLRAAVVMPGPEWRTDVYNEDTRQLELVPVSVMRVMCVCVCVVCVICV